MLDSHKNWEFKYCKCYCIVLHIMLFLIDFLKKDVNFLPVFFLISFHTMCAISLSNLTLCPLHWFTMHFFKKRKTRINGQFDHLRMILIWISFLQHTHSQPNLTGRVKANFHHCPHLQILCPFPAWLDLRSVLTLWLLQSFVVKTVTSSGAIKGFMARVLTPHLMAYF